MTAELFDGSLVTFDCREVKTIESKSGDCSPVFSFVCRAGDWSVKVSKNIK